MTNSNSRQKCNNDIHMQTTIHGRKTYLAERLTMKHLMVGEWSVSGRALSRAEHRHIRHESTGDDDDDTEGRPATFLHRRESLLLSTCAEYAIMSSSSRDFYRKRSLARRVERCCCGALAYFPLLFVYGLLSWAAWVQISIGFWPNLGKWTGKY
jgi:hypothetical protein